MSAGNRSGPVTRNITVTTNDRNHQNVTIACVANVLAAMKVEPQETVNFGAIKRSFPEQKQTVKISRGDGGPIKPRVVSTGSPQVTAELRELEPGEHYELDITIAPPWPNGFLRGAIALETGLEKVPQQTISVFASITPRLQANPPRFMLRSGHPEELDLTARLVWDAEPGRVTEATVNDPVLSVRLEEQEGQQVVVLHVPAGYTGGVRSAGSVTLVTDDPGAPTLQIPISLVNMPRTAVSPTPTAIGGEALSPTAVGPTATQVRTERIRTSAASRPASPSPQEP